MAIFGEMSYGYNVWDMKKQQYPYGAITDKDRVTNIRKQVDETVYGDYLFKKDSWNGAPVQRWRFKTAEARDKFCKDFNGTPY